LAAGGPEDLLGVGDWRGRICPGNQRPDVALKTYFQGIHLCQEKKKYSDCASEMVRVES
jgi:hypothetical protein